MVSIVQLAPGYEPLWVQKTSSSFDGHSKGVFCYNNFVINMLQIFYIKFYHFLYFLKALKSVKWTYISHMVFMAQV